MLWTMLINIVQSTYMLIISMSIMLHVITHVNLQCVLMLLFKISLFYEMAQPFSIRCNATLKTCTWRTFIKIPHNLMGR